MDFDEVKFPLSSLVNEVNGTYMIGSCDLNFILTEHRGILYADIVTTFSIEVDSFYLCAALLLHTSSIISSAWSSGSHSIQSLLYYSPTTIFSKYSPQTSQNQCLEEASIGLCVGATP